MRIGERTRELTEYYDEAASSFEATYRYCADGGPAAERRYNWERDVLASRVGEFGFGDLCDVGAGTGYWLARYLENAATITLIEPSSGMREQLREKVASLGVADRVRLVGADHTALADSHFDSILLSGVLGHYGLEDQVNLLRTVCAATRQSGEVLLIDSMHSDRSNSLHPARTGYVKRRVQGHETMLYKHYFRKSEIDELIARSGLSAGQQFFGTYFWFASCVPAEDRAS